jgi:hypothetical protein
MVILIAMYVLMPVIGKTLFRENQFVENLTWGLYLLSFLFGSYQIHKLANIRFRNNYLLLPIFGLIGFIDETSMGANIFGYQLPYYAHYNVRLAGLKTFFQFIKMHIYFNDLTKEFSQLIMLFLANLAFLFLYLYWIRTKTTYTRVSTKYTNLLRIWLIISILLSSVGVSQLLLLETHPNITCELGCYSLRRLILIVIIVVTIIILLSALISTYRRPDWVEKFAKRFNHNGQKILVILSIAVYGLGWLFLAAHYLQVIPPSYEALASRGVIIVFLITIQGSITVMSIFIWQGAFLQPMRHYIKNIGVFLNRYPAYYFVIISIAFLVVAQSIDLSITKIEFAHGVVIEELFELEASITLLFGTLAINKNQVLS